MTNWLSYIRRILGVTAAGSAAAAGSWDASASVPDATAPELTHQPPAPLVFERPAYNEGQLFAGHSSHSSHSSHASHSSHSSHYSGSGGGYTYEPSPAPPPVAEPSFTPSTPPSALSHAGSSHSGGMPSQGTTYLVMIMRVQSKLHELGYYTGTIDGVLGPATREALKNFQMVKRFPATGRMDDATLAALGITY